MASPPCVLRPGMEGRDVDPGIAEQAGELAEMAS
jgi:hypothetical protein